MHWYRGKNTRIFKRQQTSVCVVTWIYVTINIKITFEASQAVLAVLAK